jgi:hypothetical protein
MAKSVSPNVVTQQPSSGLTTWITMGIGTLFCLSFLAIAIILVLSLIPLYISKSNLISSSNSNTASSSITQNFLSNWSPTSSQSSSGVSNTNSLANSIISAYALPSNSIRVSKVALSSGTSTSGRRRRETDRTKRQLQACSLATSSQTVLGMSIIPIYPASSITTASKTNFFNNIQTKLNGSAPSISQTLQFNDGTSAQVTFAGCSGSSSGTSSTAGANSTSTTPTCDGCITFIDAGYYNFFLSGTSYVGYPVSSYNGSCTNICANFPYHCNSNYGLCSTGNITRYNTCNIVSTSATCAGIAAYVDYNGAVGAAPGAPAGCLGSNTFCCCVSA